jgi:hypothetical protein
MSKKTTWHTIRKGPNGIGFIQSRERRGSMYSVAAFMAQDAISNEDKTLLKILLGAA